MGNIVYAISNNIISSLGMDTNHNLRKMLNDETGIKPINDAALYVKPIQAATIDWGKIKKNSLYPKLGNYHKLEQLMILSAEDALSNCDVDPKDASTVFIIATTKGNIDLIEGLKEGEEIPADVYPNRLAKRISTYFGNKNTPITICNACISGVVACTTALHTLKAGFYKNAIVIGGDLLTKFVISGFESFNSVSENPCKPYDKDRDGLSMGEGVGTIILSTEKEKCTDIQKVMLTGGSTSNDANHISGPSRTGDGLYFAMRDAMEEAQILPYQFDLIDTHGTATVYNDEMESKAIGLAHMEKTPVLSLKGFFGHTLGASGVIETIICIEMIRRQMIFSTLNYKKLGVPVPINVSTETKETLMINILKTASGFGGCNAALVLSLQDPGKMIDHLPEIETFRKCDIANGHVKVNDKTVVAAKEGEDWATFIRRAFKSESEPYLKFGKMDDLCRLAVTAADYLLQDIDREGIDERGIALLLSCHSSSLETDLKHQKIIEESNPFIPSPAVFVYTLANIMQGEISIRHKLKGENTVYCIEKEDDSRLREKAQIALAHNALTQWVITGYVDFLRGNYKAHLEIIKKK